MSLRLRVFSGIAWIAIANLANRGTLMIAMMISARILGKSHFGELGLLQSTVTMFESVAALGMGVTAAKHVAEYRKTNTQLVSGVVALTNITTLLMGLLIAGFVYLLAPWMSPMFLGSEDLIDGVKVCAGILLMNTIIGGQAGILNGLEAYRTLAGINLFGGLLTIPLIAGGAHYFGVFGALSGMLAISALNASIYLLSVFLKLRAEKVPWRINVSPREIRMLWAFSLPAMLAGVMVAPVNWATGVYLVQNTGYSQMGIFNAANQWFSILLFIPGVLTYVFLPVLADHRSDKGEKSLRRTLDKGVKGILYISIISAIPVIILSKFIMGLYGSEYQDAYPLLICVAATAIVVSTQNMLGNALAVSDRMWFHFYTNLLWAISLVALAFYLIKDWGALGLCLAALGAYSLKLAITVGLVYRIP